MNWGHDKSPVIDGTRGILARISTPPPHTHTHSPSDWLCPGVDRLEGLRGFMESESGE